jgi:hypothetical protein
MTPSPDIIRDFSRLQTDCQALGKSNVELANSNVKLRQEIERALIALEDMVVVAESQGWDNAEIHNARDILSNIQMSCTAPKEHEP